MCSAIFWNHTLARTTDRQGSLGEHQIIADKTCTGGIINTPQGRIWIDGINESGLMIALLNYRKELTKESADSADISSKTKIHPGKLIPALLEACGDVRSAAEFLGIITLAADEPTMYPHYILADKTGNCIIFENNRIIENPLGILTNAPSFGEQRQNLPDLTESAPNIPWNYTSESRFARLAWLKMHASEPETTTDFMNLLDAVAVQSGADPRKGYRTVIRTVLSAKDGTYSFCTDRNRTVRTIPIGTSGEFPLDPPDRLQD